MGCQRVERTYETAFDSDESHRGRCLQESQGHKEETITLHFHGSCSECHHFHRHVAFGVPTDDSRPSRFFCERCQHPMFGLGRTETQISLASRDSFPLVNGSVAYPSVPLDILTASAELNTTRNALTNQTSQVGSSNSVGLEKPHRNQKCNTATKSSPPFYDLHRQTPLQTMVLGRICMILAILARYICGRSRRYSLCGFSVSFDITSDYCEDNMVSRSVFEERGMKSAATAPNTKTPGQRTLTTNLVGSKDSHIPFHVLPRSTQDRRLSSKEDYLRNHRRDQTLRKQVLQRICGCVLQGQYTVKESHSPDRSKSEVLDASRSQFTGMDLSGELVHDGHFDETVEAGGSPTSNSPSSGPEQVSALLGHLGGAFSAQNRSLRQRSGLDRNDYQSESYLLRTNSNASSVSLYPSRPIFIQRSLSTPGLSFQEPSIVADVWQNLTFTSRMRSSSANRSVLPWLYFGSIPDNEESHPDKQKELGSMNDGSSLHSGPSAGDDQNTPSTKDPLKNDGT